jgi:hypothetical protein
VLLLGALAGCAQSSTAAPSTVIRGHELWTSAAGATLIDATRAQALTVTETSPGGIIQLLLSTDCSHGATIRIAPAHGLRIVGTAPATDGRLAGVELRPGTRVADLVVTHPDGQVTHVRMRLG